MNRHAVTDDQWAILEPLLPKRKTRIGRPPADSRRVIDGILYVLKTGCAWMDLPREYGPYSTAFRRFNQWSADGTWDRVWRTLLSLLDEQEQLDWARAFLDGSFVPAKKGAMGSARPRLVRAAR